MRRRGGASALAEERISESVGLSDAGLLTAQLCGDTVTSYCPGAVPASLLTYIAGAPTFQSSVDRPRISFIRVRCLVLWVRAAGPSKWGTSGCRMVGLGLGEALQ